MPHSFPERLAFRHYGILALLAFLLALPGRMTLPPLDRDEPRYMEASAQMLTSGNFVDIRFQGQPRYLQPAGIYWLEAASTKIAQTITGQDLLRQSWPYRIPSLIAAALIIPLTAWMGATLFSASVGVMAAFFLMASTLFVAESHMATIDTVLLLDIMVAQSLLLRCFSEYRAGRPRSVKLACCYWIVLGMGLMLKGPIVLIPTFGTILALCGYERSTALWRRLYPLWGWLISLGIVLPWCLAISFVSHGDFFARAVGHNLLGKVAHSQESHGFWPGYYLILLLPAFWPGSFFLIRALPQIWRERSHSSIRFLLCWILPHWIFFELLATKLPHYVLPTYPALSILVAASLFFRPFEKNSAPHHDSTGNALSATLLIGLYGVLWGIAAIGFAAAGPALLLAFEPHLPPMILAPALITFWASLPLLVMALFLIARHKAKMASFYALGAAFIIHIGIFRAVIPHLSLIQFSPHIVANFDSIKPCAESILVSTSYKEPSLVFLAGEKTRLLSPALAVDALEKDPHCTLALIAQEQKPLFMAYLRQRHIEPLPYGDIAGFNYSNGHQQKLEFFAALPSP